MLVKCRELDGRNQLFGIMKYQITCKLPAFFEIRSWCWENWGPGIEYEHFINYARVGINPPMIWSWDCSKYHGGSINSGKIYVPNHKMKTLLMLTWQPE